MKALRDGIDLDEFFGRFPEAAERLLILDYDGTLSPFRTDRAKAFPYPGITELIGSIMRARRSRVVIISGRMIGELTELLSMEAMPEVWGSHGWEYMNPDGSITTFRPPAAVLRRLEEAFSVLADKAILARIERKTASIAVHWRGLPDGEAEALRATVVERWQDIAESDGLYMADFDGGIELRAENRDKGIALENVLADSPENSICAYLGDDRTDEDAFRALGERGLGVLVNNELRPTAADIWIRPPDELHDFLSRWAAACRGD